MLDIIIDKLENINYNMLFDGFLKYDCLITYKNKMYLNRAEIEPINDINSNSIYKISGKLYAAWNMDNNSPNWNVDDIVAGILHEMFHCFQVENGWAYNYKKIVFNENILDNLLQNYYNIFYNNSKKDFLYGINKKYVEDILIVQNIEGTALWIELLYKKIYCNKSIFSLMENYLRYIIASRQTHLIHYLIGCHRCYLAYQKGTNNVNV